MDLATESSSCRSLSSELARAKCNIGANVIMCIEQSDKQQANEIAPAPAEDKPIDGQSRGVSATLSPLFLATTTELKSSSSSFDFKMSPISKLNAQQIASCQLLLEGNKSTLLGQTNRLFMITLILLSIAHQYESLQPILAAPRLNLNFASSRHLYPQQVQSKLELAKQSTGSPTIDRYRYELSDHSTNVPPQSDGASTSSASIQSRLDEFRQLLGLELAKERQAAIGSPCLSHVDCNKSLANSHCKMETLTCTCLPQHVAHNSTTCLPPALLGFACQVDAQCQQRVANSQCVSGVCSCTNKFVAFRRDKCLGASQLDDYCLGDQQCQLADRHSHCKWRIPQVYGLCKCYPNYKLIRLDGRGSNSSMRCAPRLGDSCLADEECLLATENSRCQLPGQTDGSGPSWRTSGASAQRCTCASGFTESANRLECGKQLEAPTVTTSSPVATVGAQIEPAGQVTLSIGDQMDAKHEYELVIAQRTKLAPKTSSRPATKEVATVAPKLPPPQPPQPEVNEVKPSSLGKACSSRRDCQARDPNSDCLNGRCECSRPTSRCSASFTGCQPGTFQCRNGQCISWYFVCDHFANCDDGSDEDECKAGQCPPEAFQCAANGQCVALAKLCDGKPDCPDGSDELQCSSNFDPHSAANNLINNSITNSSQTRQCHPRAFTCDNGQCLPAYVLCNAVADCQDGSDESELLCERKWRPPSKAPLGHDKPSGGRQQAPGSQQTTDSPLVRLDRPSINKMLAGLNLAASRVSLTPPRTPQKRGQLSKRAAAGRHQSRRFSRLVARECPSSAFTCANGRCRSSAILCSGVDGCGDNSDELRCQVCQCEPPN